MPNHEHGPRSGGATESSPASRPSGPPSRLRFRHVAAGAAVGSLAFLGACNAGDLFAPSGADGTTPVETPAPALPRHGGGGGMPAEEPPLHTALPGSTSRGKGAR